MSISPHEPDCPRNGEPPDNCLCWMKAPSTPSGPSREGNEMDDDRYYLTASYTVASDPDDMEWSAIYDPRGDPRARHMAWADAVLFCTILNAAAESYARESVSTPSGGGERISEEEIIEAFQRARYERTRCGGMLVCSSCPPWDELSPEAKTAWRDSITDDMRAAIAPALDALAALHRENSTLRAERETLAKDKERLDWLNAHPYGVSWGTGYLGAPGTWISVRRSEGSVPRESLRAAIDAASSILTDTTEGQGR